MGKLTVPLQITEWHASGTQEMHVLVDERSRKSVYRRPGRDLIGSIVYLVC